MAGLLILASLAFLPPAQAESKIDLDLLHDPCLQPGALNVVYCAIDNGEILVCNAVYGYDNCLPIIYVDGSAAIAIGPCDDPGLVAVVECAEDNGEILVCNAVYGRDNCLPIIILTDSSVALGFLIGPCQDPGLMAVAECAGENGERTVCNALYGGSVDKCLTIAWVNLPDTTATTAASLAIGPCDDPGLVAVVGCARENGERTVCNAVFGTDDCIKKILASLISTETASASSADLSATFLDPCLQPGAVAVVNCAVDNSETLVCNAVYGRDYCLPVEVRLS